MLIDVPDHAILREAAARALGEDCGPLDLTSEACVPPELKATGRIFSRESCVVAGLPVAQAVFAEADISLQVTLTRQDGDRIMPGDELLRVEGAACSILTAERVALNFLQQLSGVATKTRAFVDAVAAAGGTSKVLDTRKTFPGLRALQKYAVRCGGGYNHRMGLYDAFMIKDNHLALMGEPDNWRGAVERARALDPDAPIIIEADTLAQVCVIAELPIQRVLLDNMSNEEMTEAVRIVAGKMETEASGNMTLQRIGSVALTGVDAISVGELTHSIASVDFSLEMELV